MSNKNRRRVLELQSWHSNWKKLKVAVLGLGVTGFSVADTLTELGANVLVIAASDVANRKPLIDVIGAKLELKQNECEQLQALKEFQPELVIVSPGYRLEHPLIVWAEENNVPVWGDIDLAWRLRDKTGRVADWICITGTNGKTTTSQLTAHMLVAGGFKAAPVGNIGTPILDAIRDPAGFDVLVVELSSFQLERLQQISPYASVCLNIATDHIDWHGGMSEYVKAKAKIYENTQIACVYNRQDRVTEKMVEEAEVIEGARAISFGLDTPPVSGLGIVEGLLIDRGFHDDRRSTALELYSVRELAEQNMDAPHLVEDILAAAALARSKGVTPDQIAAAIKNFNPDNHRMQLILNHNDVKWIDDSKATNAHAAEASLSAYEKVVWVVGGLLKGQTLDNLIKKHQKRFRAVILIGKDRQELLDSLTENTKNIPIIEVAAEEDENVMKVVVSEADRLAKAGDVVLLSPAAASMDQFKSFEDRGLQFQKALHELKEDDGCGDGNS